MRPGFLSRVLKLSWVETKISFASRWDHRGALVPLWSSSRSGAFRHEASARGSTCLNPAIVAAVIIALGAVQSLVAIMAIYREGASLKRAPRHASLAGDEILGAHVVVSSASPCAASGSRAAGKRLFRRDVGERAQLHDGRAAQHPRYPVARLLGRQSRSDRASRNHRAVVLYRCSSCLACSSAQPAADRVLRAVAYLRLTHAVALLQGVGDGSG